jgi:hypothetical protein
MRTLMKLEIPIEAGNKAQLSGAIEETLRKTLADLKPEAAYFFPENGMRGGIIVFDLKSTSDMPVIAEPLFMRLNAKVQFFPVMNADDLREGINKVKAGA